MAQTVNDPFSDANLQKAAQDLQNIPHNQVQGGLVDDATNGLGIEVEGEKDLGNGWYAEGDATWWQRTGYVIKAMFGWRGK